METPIPNFYFMGVQFIHLLALSVWVGGIVMIRGIVTPVLFKSTLSHPINHLLISEVSKQFNRTTLVCAGALIATGVIKFWRWENLTPWNAIRYFAICVMSLISAYMTFRGLQTVSGTDSASPEAPEKAFSHSITASQSNVMPDHLMMLCLVCGLTALLMA